MYIHVSALVGPSRGSVDQRVRAKVVTIPQSLNNHEEIEYKTIPLVLVDFGSFPFHILSSVHKNAEESIINWHLSFEKGG